MKKKFLTTIKDYLLRLLGRKYIRLGHCLGCGSCCKNISLKHGRHVITDLEQFEVLQRKFPVYRNFKIMDNTERGLVFQCIFLNDTTGKCLDYNNRPPLCRNYPNEIIFKLGGSLSDNCGFTFRPIKPFNKVLHEAKLKNDYS